MAAPMRAKFQQSYSLIAKCIREANLRGVSRVHVQFDPFHQRAESARQVLFMLSANKIRQTNLECSLKTDVKSDLSDPLVKVTMEDGKKIEYDTKNLSAAEILSHFNQYCRENVPEKS